MRDDFEDDFAREDDQLDPGLFFFILGRFRLSLDKLN